MSINSAATEKATITGVSQSSLTSARALGGHTDKTNNFSGERGSLVQDRKSPEEIKRLGVFVAAEKGIQPQLWKEGQLTKGGS